ncbi:uncharacterized protein LOC143603438 [Bidens hawaiensis]|uniref:uncharacterized protein LOC143603438 n=1 Tax=Bidens hawaiensis TaxID=980011 RepID=UPI00404977F6
MFNYVLGESLEKQLHRFISLITEIRSANINLTSAEINNKLVNSLPQNWDLNVAVIKKTKDLSRLTLSEVMAIIKACDMDDKQRAINHASTYNIAGYGVTANNAIVSQDSFPLFKNLVQPIVAAELDQIHPDDVEEMDISWQIAIAVFRAKKFTKRTGKNNWNVPANQKVGVNKSSLRCYNCYDPGHFARACTNPAKEGNRERAMVPVHGGREENVAGSSTGERGLVVQNFSWEDQMAALNLSNEVANFAEVDVDKKGE